MLKGKVQMGTDAATFARWHQDSLDDCSPEDHIWGWSIRSSEVIHYDHVKFDDECLRKMLLQGLCDTAAGAPAWTERVSVKEGIRFMSLVATRVFQKFVRLNDKVRHSGCLSLMKLTECPLGHVHGVFPESHHQQADGDSHKDGW